MSILVEAAHQFFGADSSLNLHCGESRDPVHLICCGWNHLGSSMGKF